MRSGRPDALLITQYYRPEFLGSGPFCADLAEWLTQRGWNVTVLAGPPHYPDATAFETERQHGRRLELINDVVVHRVPSKIPAKTTTASRIASDFSFFFAAMKALLSGKVKRHTLVIALCPSVLSVALGLAARRPGGRLVAIVHDIQSGLAQGLKMTSAPGLVQAIRLCERLMFNRTDMVSVLTQEMADQLRQNHVTSRIELLPIWVDTERFASTVRRRDGCIRITYSGNFGLKQGLGQIIELAEALLQTRPDLTITLRGNGSQADSLREAIEANRLPNVRLEEPLPPEQLHAGLQATDIHLVPQAPDAASFALPSKIFNIMAAGRPFVATALRGSPLWRIQRASRAFICVPPNNPSAFARAVVRLADDRRLRETLGQAGKQFVDRHNARSVVLQEFEERINELCTQ